MRSTGIDPSLAHALDAAFDDAPWMDGGWEAPGDAIAQRLATTLRGALTTFSPAVAVASAWSAAQGEVPMHPSASTEAWSRAALVWCACRIGRASFDHAPHSSALARLARDVAVAAAAIGARTDVALPALSLDGAIARARAALGGARGEAVEHVASEMVEPFLEQLRHTFSLLATTDRPLDALMRAAVTRADRALRRRSVAEWTACPPSVRAAIASHALLETACALALTVPDEHVAAAERREACAWLGRTAGRIAACAARTEAWLSDADRANARDESPGISLTESNRPVPSKEPTVNANNAPSNDPPSILKTLEHDATDAAWRTAGSQFVKLAREPLVALLSRHLSPDDASFRARVAAFLDTELGAALLASLLSVGLGALPSHAGQVPQRLSRELRVRAMSDAGDVLAELLTGPLRQVMALYIQDPGGSMLATAEPPAALTASSARSTASNNVVAMTGEREAVG